ncbi:hypothetical protein Btru_055307 [Bulinus truncatus]|nr:hypothetical protein Btru_055307 [Bulinus truncatus]
MVSIAKRDIPFINTTLLTDTPISREAFGRRISYNIFKVNQTIDVPFNLGECQTISRNSYAVSQSIVSLMRHQHRRFPQLCPTDTCDSIRVSYKDTCFDVVGDVPLSDNEGARAQIDILNTDHFLLDTTVNLYSRLESVLFDAFYDLTIINDSLAMFQGCSEGQVLKLDGSCEPCQEGYFANINSYQCELCPRHTYSSKPVKNSCTKCPSDTQTASPGSTKASQCEAVTDRSTIIIAACAGGVGLLCVILVVIIIIVCCKRRHSQEEACTYCKGGFQCLKADSAFEDTKEEDEERVGSQNTDDYSYGRFGYNLPSNRNWDTDSLHDYKNPGYLTDYLTPVQPPAEESCSKGYFWNMSQPACEKCEIGSYQDMLGNYDNTSCKQCPAMTTTWIKGATQLFYCKIDCPLGTEYSFQYNNCTLCPVGHFRNASLQFCYVCHREYTTINSGSTACTRTPTLSNNPKLNVTINLSFTVGVCENVNHVSSVVKNNIRFLLGRQRRNYSELCQTEGCEDIKIVISNMCRNDERSLAQLDFTNIRENLLNKALNLYRNSVSVILESFYDMTVINDSLDIFYECANGQVLKPDGSCEMCQEGHFSSTSSKQCEKCPRNTYSSNPVNNICIPCPSNQRTDDAGSKSVSQCKDDVTLTIIIATSAGGGGLLCIIIAAVVLIMCCKRKQRRREDSVISPTPSKFPKQETNLQHHPRANSNKYVHPRLTQQQQHLRDTASYVYGNHEYGLNYGYNQPSKHKWETESLHDYKNPSFILDHETPVQEPLEGDNYLTVCFNGNI